MIEGLHGFFHAALLLFRHFNMAKESPWPRPDSRKRKVYEHFVYPSYKDEAARTATA